jgi:hypothetical protein
MRLRDFETQCSDLCLQATQLYQQTPLRSSQSLLSSLNELYVLK